MLCPETNESVEVTTQDSYRWAVPTLQIYR